VVAEQKIVFPEQERQCCRHGFLADAKMDRAPHLVGRMVFREQGFLHPAQAQHLTVQLQTRLPAGGPRVERHVIVAEGDCFIWLAD